jgi:signal transduction histidine kinase
MGRGQKKPLGLRSFIELYDRVLRDIDEDWSGTKSTDPALWDEAYIASRLSKPIKKCLSRLRDFSDSDVDLLELQTVRAFVPADEGRPLSPIVRAQIGPLGRLFDGSNCQRQGAYPFLGWKYGVRLRVHISERFRTKGRSDHKEPFGRNNTFETTLDAIEEATSKLPHIEEAVSTLLRHTPNTSFFPDVGGWKRRYLVRDAARVVIQSSTSACCLMRKEFFAKAAIEHIRLKQRLRLPHQDERHIVFISVRASGEPIGGAAIHSHRRVQGRAVRILDVAVRQSVYRVRSEDEIEAAKINARYKSYWDLTASYVHRLAHDVRKPATRAKAILDDLIARTRANGGRLTSEAWDALEKLSAQLEVLSTIAGSRVAGTLDELRDEVRRDAQPESMDRLLQQAIWLWRSDAERRSVSIESEIVGGEDVIVSVPRQLVLEVLGNLISNACEYASTRIVVRGAVTSGVLGERSVMFEVSDDGPGMEDSAREKAMIGSVPEVGAPAGLDSSCVASLRCARM